MGLLDVTHRPPVSDEVVDERDDTRGEERGRQDEPDEVHLELALNVEELHTRAALEVDLRYAGHTERMLVAQKANVALAVSKSLRPVRIGMAYVMMARINIA